MRHASKRSIQRARIIEEKKYWETRYCFPIADIMYEDIDIRAYLKKEIPWLYDIVYVHRRLSMRDEQDVSAILDWLSGATYFFGKGKYSKAYEQIMSDCIKSTNAKRKL